MYMYTMAAENKPAFRLLDGYFWGGDRNSILIIAMRCGPCMYLCFRFGNLVFLVHFTHTDL